MATVVLNVRLITQVQQITTPVAIVHAIVLVPRHVHDSRVHHLHTVAVMAAHQHLGHNIMVGHAAHRLQHAR